MIVKTDLNHAGLPEYKLAQRRAPLWRRLARRAVRKLGQRHAYRVHASLDDVPRAALRDPRLVVERFVAERVGDQYCVRIYQFLGDRHTSARVVSRDRVIKADGQWTSHPVEPEPGIVALRRELGYDFGKFDYVMQDGEAVLLDANKTPGGAALPPTPERMSRWRDRARGILSFL